MKLAFDAYPKVLFIDVTYYNLNNLRMPLYIMAGVSGNGETEIFATFIVVNEEKITIKHFVKNF